MKDDGVILIPDSSDSEDMGFGDKVGKQGQQSVFVPDKKEGTFAPDTRPDLPAVEYMKKDTPIADKPTVAITDATMDVAGRILDHIVTTKKIMEETGKPLESMVPLLTTEKKIPDSDLYKLYSILEKPTEPEEQDEYPYYNKSESGEIAEGTQLDKYYKTKIPFVRVVEAWDKDSNQLLEAHIVIGPIKVSGK